MHKSVTLENQGQAVTELDIFNGTIVATRPCHYGFSLIGRTVINERIRKGDRLRIDDGGSSRTWPHRIEQVRPFKKP